MTGAPLPWEAFDQTHPDHEWWFQQSGRCWDSDCETHVAVQNQPLQPAVPPSSAVQGSVRTEGPTEVGRRLKEALKGYGVTAEQAAANLLANAPQVVCGPLDADEPSVETRLRSLADAEIEAAKNGTRTQKAAAKAAAQGLPARSRHDRADMIEEEQA